MVNDGYLTSNNILNCGANISLENYTQNDNLQYLSGINILNIILMAYTVNNNIFKQEPFILNSITLNNTKVDKSTHILPEKWVKIPPAFSFYIILKSQLENTNRFNTTNLDSIDSLGKLWSYKLKINSNECLKNNTITEVN